MENRELGTRGSVKSTRDLFVGVGAWYPSRLWVGVGGLWLSECRRRSGD